VFERGFAQYSQRVSKAARRAIICQRFTSSSGLAMFAKRILPATLTVTVLAALWPIKIHAAWVFLGPTPYLSRADSPFPVDGSNANFFLEDFEDGLLNTPGIFQPLLPITHASVLQPHQLTDSVDGDDGVVDGNGQGGHALAANAYMVFPTNPPFTWSTTRFGFDKGALGHFPNAFGFVWTDGVSPSTLLVEFFDQDWQFLAQRELGDLGDDRLTGETADDRFLGFVSDTPFAFVQITNKYPGPPYTFEIDHVQYGVIPEPTGLILAVVGVLLFGRVALADGVRFVCHWLCQCDLI
jgi:hypothetical protein